MNCATYNMLLDVGKNIDQSSMVKLIWEILYFIPSHTPHTKQLAFPKIQIGFFFKKACFTFFYSYNPRTVILQVDF